jgi:hypothetical protein
LTLGFQQFALTTHRLHPAFISWATNWLKCEQIPGLEHIFPLSVRSELKVLVFRGDLKRKPGETIRQLWNRIDLLSNEKAAYIIKRIPESHRIHLNFDLPLFIRAMQITRLYITPWKCLPSGRALSDRNRLRQTGKKSLLTTTPCFMFIHLQIWGRGIFNFPGVHCGNCFDFCKTDGLALYFHELFHIYQFLRNPFGMIWNYIKAVRDSLVHAHIFFSHPHIPFEVEAIAFQYAISERLVASEASGALNFFKSFQK